MRGRLLVITALVAVALGVASEARGAPIVTHFTRTLDISGGRVTCSSETLVLQGTVTISGRTVFYPGRLLFEHFVDMTDGTAVGESSGTVYRIKGVQTNKFGGTVRSASVDKEVVTFLAVPVDGGKPLSFHMIEIFIFNPGGELVNFKFDQRGECV